MKFSELRAKCMARAYRLIVTRPDGKSRTIEISLDYTAVPNVKLAKRNEDEVVSFRPTITQWPVGYVNTLEVELRANHSDDH
jgi:hypothetical protein